jgi:ABC-type transport system involved in multi-copper enzyme maturation permease subunit
MVFSLPHSPPSSRSSVSDAAGAAADANSLRRLPPRAEHAVLAQNIMQVAPTTHFVAASQAILYRGAGFDVVWPQILALAIIGAVFFVAALAHFRKSISQMA